MIVGYLEVLNKNSPPIYTLRGEYILFSYRSGSIDVGLYKKEVSHDKQSNVGGFSI